MTTSPSSCEEQKLSLASATLINLNMIIGSGLFINTVLLANLLGGAAPFAYIAIGLCIAPIVFVFRDLLSRFQKATFYDLGAKIHPMIGFLSGWTYFTAKLASCSLGIHVFVSTVQVLVPCLQSFSTLTIDFLILLLFLFLNTLNLATGRSIQFFFFFLKSLPILFAILTMVGTFNSHNIIAAELPFFKIPSCFPIILFAMTGFEATCSLSSSIKNSTINGPRAIRNSFIAVIIILFLYQLSFIMAFGPELGALGSFHVAFPALIQKVLPFSPCLVPFFKVITLSGIAISSLGASYGILFSNTWNIFTLAREKLIVFHEVLTYKNKFAIPFVSVFIQGLFVCFYTYGLGNAQTVLQQINGCGVTIAYTISVISFMYLLAAGESWQKKLLAFGAACSCLLMLCMLVLNAITFSAQGMIVCGILILIGMTLMLIQKYTARKQRA